jgi:hypothetical protein
VTLSNPFGFDLDLSNTILSITGIEFNAIPTATTILSYDTLSLRLMGTLLEIGNLIIRGCIIKITGFAEQEFLNEKPPVEKVIEKDTFESERYKHTGLSALYKQVSHPIESTTTITTELIQLIKVYRVLLKHIKSNRIFKSKITSFIFSIRCEGHIKKIYLKLSF